MRFIIVATLFTFSTLSYASKSSKYDDKYLLSNSVELEVDLPGTVYHQDKMSKLSSDAGKKSCKILYKGTEVRILDEKSTHNIKIQVSSGFCKGKEGYVSFTDLMVK